jgi:hypothetical protein
MIEFDKLLTNITTVSGLCPKFNLIVSTSNNVYLACDAFYLKHMIFPECIECLTYNLENIHLQGITCGTDK